MKWKELQENIDEDIALPNDLSKLDAKIKSIPKLHSKYLNFFFKEKKKLLILEKDLKKSYREKYYYYKNDYEYTLKNNQIDWHIESDDDYAKKKFEFDKQKMLVEYFYKLLQKINTLSFDIKNLIEWRNLLSGRKG